MSIDDARQAKEQLQHRLAGHELVNGIGLRREDEGWVVQVNVVDTPPPGHDLPDSVNGVEVRYSTIGPITKLDR